MLIIFNLRTVKPGKTLGVAHYCLNLIKELRQIPRVKLHVLVDPDSRKSYETIFGEDIVKTRKDLRRLTGLRKLVKYLRFSKKYDFEILAHHFQDSDNLAEQVAVIVHDLHIFDVPWKYKKRDIFLKKINNNLNAASFVLTPWIRPYQSLSSYFPEVPGLSEKVFFMNSPVLLQSDVLDSNASSLFEQQNEFDMNANLILYPAQLQRHKNHTVLLRAMELIKNDNVQLICPGSDQDEDYKRELFGIMKEKRLESRVFFPGYVSNDELLYLYKISSLVISPSLAEGGNAIALEAISFDKPVICADTEPTRMQRDLIGAEFPVFTASNADELATLILRTLDARDYYVSLNQNAREYLKTISWKSVAKTVYEKLRQG